MAQNLPGFPSPSAGFDAPLDMLSSCHERMHAMLALLERLSTHIAKHGADQEAHDAASRVIKYFDTAAVHHHADEEEDLFPALLEAVAGSDAVCIRELTQALSTDHRELERHWQALRPGLQAIASSTGASATPWEAEAAATFVAAYRSHLGREDADLLPLAERLLGRTELNHLGKAMKDRRDKAYGAGGA